VNCVVQLARFWRAQGRETTARAPLPRYRLRGSGILLLQPHGQLHLHAVDGLA
jgi:hypothetical protein